MARGGGKVNVNWMDLDYTSEGSINANNLAYDSSVTIKQAIQNIGGGGAGMGIREIEYFTLTPTRLSQQYVVLTHTPLDIEIQFLIVGGPSQEYTKDYILKETNKISWSPSDCTIGLSSVLIENDIIQIEYTKTPGGGP